MDGPDHQASLDPNELQKYITLAQQAMVALGTGEKQPLAEELPVKNLVRFSVVTAKFMEAGSIITKDMVTTKRPGTGISASELELVIGAKAVCDMKADVPVMRESIVKN